MKCKKIMAGVLSAVMVLGIMAMPAFADDKNISSQEEFEAALNTLADGDTLSLNSGNYTIPESITNIDKSITINGIGKDITTVKVNKPISVTADSFDLTNLNLDGSAINEFNNDRVISFSVKNVNVQNVDFSGGGTNTSGANIALLLDENGTADFVGCKFSGAFRGIQINKMQKSTVEFDKCIFNPQCYTLNINGAQLGGLLVVKDSVMSGWTSYAEIEKAVFRGVTFEKMSGGCVYNFIKPYADTYFEDCDFNFDISDMNQKLEMVHAESELAITNCRLNGANVDSSNISNLFSGDSKVNGDGVMTPVAKNGLSYYATLKDAVAAAQDGDTITIIGKVAVKPGDTDPTIDNKTLTFEGNGTAELTFVDGTGYNMYYAHGSNLTFKNLTLTWKDHIDYQGIAHTNTVNYNNCTINGQLTLYGAGEKFDGCTFVQKADNEWAHNIWTWGATESEFTNCVFRCRGKSINVYGGGEYTTKDDYLAAATKKLTIDGCEFYVEDKVENCDASAITIKTQECPYDININNSTATGFVTGKMSGQQLYDVKYMNKNVPADEETAKVTINNKELDLAPIKAKLIDDATPTTKPVLKIAFVKNDAASDEDSHVYDIKVVSGSDINELNTTELTFDFETDKANEYTITPAEDIVLTGDNANANHYMFSFKNGEVRKTVPEITIGQATVTGYGKYTLKVDDTAVSVVNATTFAANLVDTYATDGSADGKLDVADSTTDVNGEKQEIKIPTRKLAVKISMNNKVEDQKKSYQDMKVEIAGGDYTETIALGSDALAQINKVYTVERELPINTAYIVTISGAGYRTARYTVNLTENKTLNFWNNVAENAIEVELGNDTYKKDVTFLAGDIVKDNNINIYDLSAVVSYFGTDNLVDEHPEYAKYDLNRDGKIDSKDVAYVLVSWGK